METTLLRHSLGEFFRTLVQSAMRAQEVETSEHTEHYLVRLLERFAHPDPGWNERPLALDYLESFHHDRPTRLAKLRRVGDTALFLSGVFMEHLERQLVSADYYINLGRVAYGHLSANTGNVATDTDVFGEMSSRFPELAAVLGEIGFQQIARSDRELVRVYTRWLHTRSRRDAQWLVRRGVLPVDPGGSRGGH